MTQHIRALTLAPEQMNRLYECGSYAKANDSTPDSSHLEKRVMRLPPMAIAEMRADKIRVNREHGGDPRRVHGMFLRVKLSAAFRLLEDPPSSDIIQEDWELAGMLMRYSRRCYEENLQEYRNENLKRRADYRDGPRAGRYAFPARHRGAHHGGAIQLAEAIRVQRGIDPFPVQKTEIQSGCRSGEPDGFRKDQTQEGHEGRPLVFACVSDLPICPPTHYCRKGFRDLPTRAYRPTYGNPR